MYFTKLGNNHRTFKYWVVAGIWALLAVVIVYPLIVLNHDINDEKSKSGCKIKGVTCNHGKLSTSYFLEIGAIILTIIGLVLHTDQPSKKH